MNAFLMTAVNVITRLASGPVIMVLVPIYLSSEQQGYWYTMISLTAFVSFADMGLSTILIHSGGHAYGMNKLRRNEVNEYNDRIQDLRTVALQLYSFRRSRNLAIFSGVFIFILGQRLLGSDAEHIYWEVPWALLCIACAASLILTIALSFFESHNAVIHIQSIRAIVGATNLVVVGTSLVAGLGLWALFLGTCVSCIAGYLLLLRHTNKMRRKRLSFSEAQLNTEIQKWSHELSPLIHRYSVSWVGGYAMFYLFTPIAFHFFGAEAAGRVGLSIALFSALFSFSTIWSTFQLPSFSIAISKSDWSELDRLLKFSLWGSILSYLIALMALAFIYVCFLQYFPDALSRILNIENLLALSLIWFFQLLIHTLAIYLRAFREEPLAVQTIIATLHSWIATVAILYFFGLDHLFWGLLSVYSWFVPVTVAVYRNKVRFNSGSNKGSSVDSGGASY